MERRARLQRSVDFERARRAGRPWYHPMFVFIAAPNGLDRTRVGVVAGRKMGKAVARNRAKRLLREAARRLYPYLMPGWDLILIARSPILDAKEPQVEAALEQIAREAGIWRKEASL